MKLKPILRSIVPPLLWNIGKSVKRRVLRSTDHYEYAPRGWATPLPAGARNEDYWNTFIARERFAFEALIARVRQGRQDAACGDPLKYVTFAYVVALVSQQTRKITVLDYGGNLGDYYWLAQALVPEVALEYHCKELPLIAAAGQELNPAVIWHTDDECLLQNYDLVMFSSSLQYVTEWRETLRRAAAATRRYLFLSDMPCVQNVPTFVATERSGGATNLHWQLNRADIVGGAQSTGLRLVQEFAMGPYPPVVNAPEQPRCTGWLFERP